jgi:hypothetical protein
MQIVHDNLSPVPEYVKNNVSKSPRQGVGKIQGQENKQGTGCPHEYVYQKMDNFFHDGNNYIPQEERAASISG